MDKIILALCNAYYYVRRRHYRLRLRKIQRLLRHERVRLYNDWMSWASTQDRGRLLDEQYETLTLLQSREMYHQQRIERYFS